MSCAFYGGLGADDIFGGGPKNERKRDRQNASERRRTEDPNRRNTEKENERKRAILSRAGTPRRSQIELR